MVVDIGPSNIETAFVLEALRKNVRVDGRGIYDYRTLRISCGPTPGLAEVQLGQTRVLARVSCEVTRPSPDRPTEGLVQFSSELSNLAAPNLDASSGGRVSAQEVAISRMVERVIRQSRAIDTEALCILAGVKVWTVRVDLHFLDHGGNLMDAAAAAAIVALRHFRRPDVTVQGEEAIIHDPRERNPVPLSIHHTPVCVSFAFLGALGELAVLDPSLLEEQAQAASFTVTLNAHKEICALNKAGGVPLSPEQIQRCTQVALTKADEISDAINAALKGSSSNK
ncbi:ribosomal protein S5 domain 2-type protein [Kickxella alabastrina]|uniref:ribosomal protein S5 domain 2-type protein n=1 Tax=Kickxella alabastrina TaxID=61397 RepID=UPI00221FA841|nr:ribosomal protein S5 domain 2-type protein [Kickxella alabastrina]KAI7824988.1 ribosomal protein S5 domain 2-type protein [Kickxella alabastrina]KAJ1945673.1 3'-5'-exoribonuclease [Kickxella alabastrina]